MQKNKKIILTFFSLVSFIFILLLLNFYFYDPMQVFDKTKHRKVTFHTNLRQQAAGIINNFNHYDSIILGTSMTENTSSKDASEKLGGKFINLSLSGSSFYEREIILHSLFRQHSLKNILYTIDVDKYHKQRKDYKKYPITQFEFLYDKNPFNDFKLYFNIKYLLCSLSWSLNKECIGTKTHLDRPNAWFNAHNSKKRFGGIDKWINSKDEKLIIETFKRLKEATDHIKNKNPIPLDNVDVVIKKSKQYIDRHIIKFVKRHPKTNFILIDPPYTRMLYAIWAQYDLPKFETYKEILRYLTIESHKYSNLEIYSFGEEDFLDKIATYRDMGHYHHSINSWKLSQISQKKGLLHKGSIDQYLQNITTKALNYDLVTLNEYIQSKINP